MLVILNKLCSIFVQGDLKEMALKSGVVCVKISIPLNISKKRYYMLENFKNV